jgi:hypothetical protein
MLTRVLRTVPLDLVDGRSQVGVALRRIREDLTSQLGDLSAAQKMLVEHAVKLHVIALAVSEYVFAQQSVVRDGELLPVLVQYGAIVANLTRLLTTLGLRAREKPARTLAEYLAERESRSRDGDCPG